MWCLPQWQQQQQQNIYFNLFKINFLLLLLLSSSSPSSPPCLQTRTHISLYLLQKVATNKIASEIARAHWIHAKEMLQRLVATYSMRTPIRSHFNFSLKRKFIFFILFYLILFLYILAYATAIVISGLGPNKTFIFILF